MPLMLLMYVCTIRFPYIVRTQPQKCKTLQLYKWVFISKTSGGGTLYLDKNRIFWRYTNRCIQMFSNKKFKRVSYEFILISEDFQVFVIFNMILSSFSLKEFL